MITLKRSLWVILGLDPRIHVFNGSWMVRSPSEVTWGPTMTPERSLGRQDSSRRADARRLDSCHKDRNEGSKLLLALTTLTLLFASLSIAHAQSPLGIGSAEPSISVGGPLAPFFQWINVHQQSFYRALTGALKAMREDPGALTSLIGLSFAYGVFHAAGPGTARR